MILIYPQLPALRRSTTHRLPSGAPNALHVWLIIQITSTHSEDGLSGPMLIRLPTTHTSWGGIMYLVEHIVLRAMTVNRRDFGECRNLELVNTKSCRVSNPIPKVLQHGSQSNHQNDRNQTIQQSLLQVQSPLSFTVTVTLFRRFASLFCERIVQPIIV